MMFKNWRRNLYYNRVCDKIIREEQSDVRIVPLRSISWEGPEHDRRPYVARMGIFSEDMMDINIPVVTWLCRADGSIWTEWQINSRYRPHEELKRWDLFNNRRRFQTETIRVEMTTTIAQKIHVFSKELWVMAKLSDEIGELPSLSEPEIKPRDYRNEYSIIEY